MSGKMNTAKVVDESGQKVLGNVKIGETVFLALSAFGEAGVFLMRTTSVFLTVTLSLLMARRIPSNSFGRILLKR